MMQGVASKALWQGVDAAGANLSVKSRAAKDRNMITIWKHGARKQQMCQMIDTNMSREQQETKRIVASMPAHPCQR
jgi:hypothetical protein